MAEQKKEGSASSDKEILEQFRENLKWAVDTNAEERKKQKDDLRFSTLDQWDGRIRKDRETDPNGSRPCLTSDKLNQYINQVVNDFRQNPVSGKVRPVSEDADEDAADVFQGAIRNIEDQSNAPVAYINAGDWAVRVGEGYFRFLTEYKSERSRKQKIVIKPVTDMFSCYLGPHKMPEGSDAPWGIIFEDIPLAKFKRLFPKAKDRGAVEFEEFDDADYWGEKETIRVAEYFYFHYEQKTIVFLDDGRDITQEEYDALPESSMNPQTGLMQPKPAIVGKRETQIKTTKWCKLTAIEILENEDWAGKYIPIVKVIGKEAWVDGKRQCWGLTRPAKDSLRMHNYWISTLTEKLALAPKAPFVGAKGQFTDGKWQNANKENYAYLEYDAMNVDGIAVPPPKRQEPTQIESGLMAMFPLIEHDVQTSLGMFKASLGEERPQQSGKAILALTRESDTGTYHFAGNMGLSVCHGSRIMIDLIPKIYDTEEVLHMLGEDGSISKAKLDPKQQVAVQRITDETGKIKKIYNLGIGDYGVTVTTGPSYNTQRMENAALFTDLANSAKDPSAAAVLHYFAIKNSDFEGSREATKAMRTLLPAPVLQALDKDQPQIPPQAAQRIQQLEQALMQAHQENTDLQSGVAETKMKVDAHIQEANAKTAAAAQTHEKEMELARAKASDEHALARQKSHDEITLARERADAEITVIRERAQMEAQVKREAAALDAQIAREKAQLDAETKIAVAEINAKTTVSTSLISAEAAANTELSKEFGGGGSAIEKLSKTSDAHLSAIKEQNKTMAALTEHLAKPRNRKITTPDGRSYTSEEV